MPGPFPRMGESWQPSSSPATASRTSISGSGFEDGIWADAGYVPYSAIGGFSWREEKEITLVIIYRLRSLVRRLVVPQAHYAEVRRLLRDKIAAHDIHFTLKSLDLGGDEREVV